MNGDSVGILRSIQTGITDDSIECRYRVSYMLDIEGKIRKGIGVKIRERKELQKKIEKTEREIRKFEGMIERVERKKK